MAAHAAIDGHLSSRKPFQWFILLFGEVLCFCLPVRGFSSFPAEVFCDSAVFS
jgi:hypothetical protein